MNDRFTFRAWNIAQKRYMEDLRLIGFGEINTFREVEEAELDKYGQPQHYTTYEEDEVVLEQCTGLKDKNGRLIYEGDIVKGSNGSINGQEWEFTHVVKWNDKLHRIVLPDFEPDEDWSHYYNVIGNIHENLELLKESK